MADIEPITGLQPAVVADYHARRRGALVCEEDEMDLQDRIEMAEKDVLRLAAVQQKHEEICALRYDAIKSGNDRIAAYIKWLAISVGCLSLAVLGVATVEDLLRSGAGRIGVQINRGP